MLKFLKKLFRSKEVDHKAILLGDEYNCLHKAINEAIKEQFDIGWAFHSMNVQTYDRRNIAHAILIFKRK